VTYSFPEENSRLKTQELIETHPVSFSFSRICDMFNFRDPQKVFYKESWLE